MIIGRSTRTVARIVIRNRLTVARALFGIEDELMEELDNEYEQMEYVYTTREQSLYFTN
ncbi:MAG: hypothetical protein ACERKV_07250 [Clostridiaceae bacterium]